MRPVDHCVSWNDVPEQRHDQPQQCEDSNNRSVEIRQRRGTNDRANYAQQLMSGCMLSESAPLSRQSDK